jgi:hypothetical protein
MKVPDSVIKVKDLELVDFMDTVQAILNDGLYETRIFTSVPSWSANEGESAIYSTGSANDLYYMIGGTWCRIGFNLLGSLTLFDSNGDTGITPEATPNEDVIRFYTKGLYNFSMGTYGFSMAPGKPLFFDGTIVAGSGTNWVFDTTDSYLKCYVGGIKRIEM